MISTATCPEKNGDNSTETPGLNLHRRLQANRAKDSQKEWPARVAVVALPTPGVGLLASRSAREHFSVVRSYSLQYFVTAPRLRHTSCPTSNPLSPLPLPLLNSHSGGVFLHIRFYGYDQEGHCPLMSGLSNDKAGENQLEARGSCWKKQGFTNHTENPLIITSHHVSA